MMEGRQELGNAYEQVGYPEKKANKAASVTSGQRSPTKILKWPAGMKIHHQSLEFRNHNYTFTYLHDLKHVKYKYRI